jgi:hypothetical protein
MPEGFEVEPHYLSGYGDLVAAEKATVGDIQYHLDMFARANPEHFEGLLSLLTTPVNQYADSVSYRLGDRAANLRDLANELHRAAWAYLGVEEENTEMYQGQPSYAEDPDAKVYYPSSPDLPSLEIAEMDFTQEFKDLSLAMFWIIWFLHSYLGWSPHNHIMEKLAGNWNALDVAGDALINVGNATEQLAGSMAEGLTTLDAHWNGGAAQSCVDYTTRLSEALGEEGPLNRTVGRLYKLIAHEASEAIRQVIRDLTLPTEDLSNKLGMVDVCVVSVPTGNASMEDAMAAMANYKELFDSARAMVETIESVVEQAKGFLESAEQVAGASTVGGAVEEMINAVSPLGQEVQEGLATAADVADLANTAEFDNAPTDAYAVGDDPERDSA